MRRYYYGMQPLLGRVRYSDSHMRNDLSASFLRPQHCRMGRAKRNPSLLGHKRRAVVARYSGLRKGEWSASENRTCKSTSGSKRNPRRN